MSDFADEAAVISAMDLRLSLARVQTSIRSGESATECEDCGEPIPDKRRKAIPGCTRCVACQEENERMRDK